MSSDRDQLKTARNIGLAITQRIGQVFAQRIGEPLESIPDDPEQVAAFLAAEGGMEFVNEQVGLAVMEIMDGWRPPAQVITDPAVADQLPAGALVITDAGVVAQRYDGMGGWWQVLDGDPIDNSAELIGTGSIEVLRIPTENGDADE